MRRLCRTVTEVALLAALAWGCGSNAGDPLVLRFIRFDSTGLTQSDSVRETSADVDVVQSLCVSGTTVTGEPFTQTIINAVFINEEGADINLQRYRVTFPSNLNLPDGYFKEQTISANIPGGRCANVDRPCAIDADCSLLGVAGNCAHTETTVNALVLFDFMAKQLLDQTPAPLFFGTATSFSIEFFGTDDANQSFEVSAGYVVTFGDFNNCPSGSIPVGGS